MNRKHTNASLTFIAVFLMSTLGARAETKSRQVAPIENEETTRKVEEIRLEQAIRARMRAFHEQQKKEGNTAQAESPRTIDQVWYDLEKSVEEKPQPNKPAAH